MPYWIFGKCFNKIYWQNRPLRFGRQESLWTQTLDIMIMVPWGLNVMRMSGRSNLYCNRCSVIGLYIWHWISLLALVLFWGIIFWYATLITLLDILDMHLSDQVFSIVLYLLYLHYLFLSYYCYEYYLWCFNDFFCCHCNGSFALRNYVFDNLNSYNNFLFSLKR